jgi:uncharacterized membrane protein YphA (DoxX/SURF4 family)
MLVVPHRRAPADIALTARIVLCWVFFYGSRRLFGWLTGRASTNRPLLRRHGAPPPGKFFAVVGGAIEFFGAIA